MKRLIVTIFSLYFIIAVLVSVVHILFEYKNIRNQIELDLKSIHTSSANSLSAAIWNFNSEQVVKLVDGLLTLQFVSGVEIHHNNDGLNVAKGDVYNRSSILYEGPIIYGDGTTDRMMGILKLTSSQSIIIDRIKINVIFIIANAFLKTFFLSIIIFIIGYRIIGKPLDELFRSVSRLDFDDVSQVERSKIELDEKFFKHKDELTFLILAYNKTLDKLVSRTTQRDQARTELEEKNMSLKHSVNEKTLALQEKITELNGMNEKLAILASRDPLTNLLNRRCFFERAEQELSRLKRNNKQAAVVIVDIDFFKVVNDKYGHPAGDAVLTVISKILKNSVRQHDLVSRFGGEEFAIFLSDVDMEKAIMLAERMRKNIAEQQVIYKGDIIKSTASFGLSMLTSDSQDINSVINDADKLLYEAKESGRNNLKY
ncbi:GGDEF domain-like protein [gamma proteobacterium IMCC1989]|nr:GGDEF domain-like protein [gamma proteobacterium IMCC1989]